MLASDVIQLLNEAVARTRLDRFPVLDVGFPIDTRLSVYRDDGEHWVIVIELLVFMQMRIGHECCMTEVRCYGDVPCPSDDFGFSRLRLTGDGPSGPLFDPYGAQQIVSSTAQNMTVRGNVVPITTDPAQYAAAGIQLNLLSNSTALWLQLEAAPRSRRIKPRETAAHFRLRVAPTHRTAISTTFLCDGGRNRGAARHFNAPFAASQRMATS